MYIKTTSSVIVTMAVARKKINLSFPNPDKYKTEEQIANNNAYPIKHTLSLVLYFTISFTSRHS